MLKIGKIASLNGLLKAHVVKLFYFVEKDSQRHSFMRRKLNLVALM